jgi:hypothetical protein
MKPKKYWLVTDKQGNQTLCASKPKRMIRTAIGSYWSLGYNTFYIGKRQFKHAWKDSPVRVEMTLRKCK